jgi:preprotein translocase subunit SecE
MAEEIKKDSEKAAPEKKAKKIKKPGIFKRMANFFKEYKSEMKKVVWYPKNRVLHDTGVVVAALAVCGVAIGLLDSLFGWLIELLGNLG